MPVSPSMRIVVTGHSGGIGSAVARNLLQLGHELVGVDRLPASPEGFQEILVDLSVPGEAARAVQIAASVIGPLNGIINCAGRYDSVLLEQFSWEQYQEVMTVNLRAPIEAALTLLKVRSTEGRHFVVNLGSVGARSASRDLAYAVSKAGLEGATRSLARSFAPLGVRVFCVCPGITDTPMSAAMARDRYAKHVQSTLLGRAGQPAEIAALVTFLATGDSDYMTGSVIDVSGGLVP
jgi:NAD(P)-dependent dehydrogenase (short-subunit alcohol dehydrogenase family)